jgi:hypothetical protein
MFLEAHVTLALPADKGKTGLERALAAYASGDPHQVTGEGLDFCLEVGPESLRAGLSKSVHARVLPARQVRETVVIPLRWEPTGRTGRMYPALDANLGITAADDVTCVLSMVSTYTPPLGAIGMGLDKVALRRVGQATIEAFLRRLAADAVEHCRRQPSRDTKCDVVARTG